MIIADNYTSNIMIIYIFGALMAIAIILLGILIKINEKNENTKKDKN